MPSFITDSLSNLSAFMPVWLQRVLQGAALVAALGLGALYHFQEALLYLPKIPGVPNEYANYPTDFGLEFEDVWLESEDGTKLHSWHVHGRDQSSGAPAAAASKPPVVLFFQENAGNMSFRLPFITLLVRHLGCAVFVLGYRGYGQSQGRPNQAGLEMDARAALAHVRGRDDVDTSKIVLYGKSLGGAVAASVAAAHGEQLKAAILENTFTSVEDMVPRVFPVLSPLIGRRKPLNWLVRNTWLTRDRIRTVTKLPLLLIGSVHDELVPYEHMLELKSIVEAVRPVAWLSCPEGGHMDAYETNRKVYWRTLREFWAENVLA